MSTTITLPGISFFGQPSPRTSTLAQSGCFKKRAHSLLSHAQRAHDVASALKKSGATKLSEADGWTTEEDNAAYNSLFAAALAGNAAKFSDTELVCNIGLCYDMNETCAFSALCDEANRRGLKLEREFFFEAALCNKLPIVRHLCARKDRICPWPTPDTLQASPLAVMLVLADDDNSAHIYNALSEVASSGFIYTNDIEAVVACVSSVAQWKFVERTFGTHARQVVKANRNSLPPALAKILAST